MDKTLLLNILGTRDSVDLGDMIYNTRNICSNLRDVINLNLELEKNSALEKKKSLAQIYDVIKAIEDNLKNADSSLPYANSRKYLLSFIINLCSNIDNLMNSLETLNMKNITYYNNIIIDLILKY